MHLKIWLRNSNYRLWALMAGALCLLAAFSVYAAWDKQPRLGYNLSIVKQPVPAPDFSLEDMDEEMHHLKDLRGKVVLLNFWATWCPPCRREMPSMERLNQSMKGKDFVVLAVNQMQDADLVFPFLGELDVEPTFTILFDNDSEVSMQYAVRGLPTTYLIDKEGNVRYQAIGGREFDHPEVEKQILSLMNES